jgi:hypothetical protein
MNPYKTNGSIPFLTGNRGGNQKTKLILTFDNTFTFTSDPKTSGLDSK